MVDEYNWTGAEEERQDCVDNAIYQFIIDISFGSEIEWDMEDIGEIRDLIQEIIVDKYHLMTEMEFYPYRELTDE